MKYLTLLIILSMAGCANPPIFEGNDRAGKVIDELSGQALYRAITK